MGNMKRTLLFAIVIATAWFVSAAFGETGNELFEKALVKERSEGNLKEAIKLYQQVVDKYGKDRTLAAKALVAMAESQEKLGKSEARKTYERIVREYGDQKEAVAAARAHLDAPAGAAQTLRQTTTLVWTGQNADDEGTVSSDGRYISYPDWKTGNLAVHDFVTGTDRAITTAGTWEKKGEAAFAEESVFSRDGKQIAYGWYEGKTNRFDLRVANVTGEANSQKIFESAEMRFLMPEDWSPDGKWIAVHMEPENSDARTGQPARPGMKAAIALVGVQDRSLRVLKTTDWSGPSPGRWKALFSPDGKYLAYDRATGSGNDQRGVYVMELASGREVAVAASAWSDQLAGWSPNGKQILFTNKRTGIIGLWAIAFTGGMPQGQAELIKPDLGSGSVVGMAAGGALYYYVASSRDLPSLQVAEFDIVRGKLTSQPEAVTAGASGEGGYAPAWSPDGKRLAYLSQKRAGSGWQFSIKIYSIEERREVREFQSTTLKPYDLRWTPDGEYLLWDDANGLQRLDLQNGEVSLLAARPKGTGLTRLESSPDGKTLYYVRKDGSEGVYLALDLVSGKERELIRRANLRGLFLSRDGAHLASGITDPAGKAKALLIIPVDGGLPREVGRVTGEKEVVLGLDWMPDSKSVLFQKPAGPNVELWQGFVDGQESHRINQKVEPALAQGNIRLSPDGRRVVGALPGHNPTEAQAPGQIMVLDHFLPAAR
jgi:Tol biopolymer transport system component